MSLDFENILEFDQYTRNLRYHSVNILAVPSNIYILNDIGQTRFYDHPIDLRERFPGNQVCPSL